jgi:hypothetical protein
MFQRSWPADSCCPLPESGGEEGEEKTGSMIQAG